MADFKWEEAFGLTDRECLFDRVSFERLKQLIREADKVVGDRRGENSYGEFRFIDIVKDGEVITLWGHGYHEYREHDIGDDWFFHHANYFVAEKPRIKKRIDDLLWELNDEHPTYARGTERARQKTEAGILFSTLADLGDEDGALAMLEDHNGGL